MEILNSILKKKSSGKKQIAILIDPDKKDVDAIITLCRDAEAAQVDHIFVGGSLLTQGVSENCVEVVKRSCNIPVILFPGSSIQIDPNADAILFLSLISGRNPDLLIGQHVIGAPIIKKYGLEVIPTGYMLIESGRTTTALYMSNTHPIPREKDDIAACTALAGEMLGLNTIFMDAGSGAKNTVTNSMIKAVSNTISIPLIVGGGIKTPEDAIEVLKSGADLIVIGNSIEEDPSLLTKMTDAVHSVMA
jgi:putative glycerol-1-phosphate prenyltransferase